MFDGPHPNLFLVGAHKSGTTSLHHYLGQHPEVFMSPDKDGGFLSYYVNGEATDEDEVRYREVFSGTEAYPVRGDASVHYMYDERVPPWIREHVPDARILISIRDPVERAYSHYWRKVAAGIEDEDFVSAVEREIRDREQGRRGLGYLHNGEFVRGVDAYLGAFDAEQVHVMLLADMKADAAAALADVFEFLGVDPGPAEEIDTDERLNRFRGIPYGSVVEAVRTSTLVKRVARAVLPKSARDWLGNEALLKKTSKPPMPEEARELLAAYFEPFNRRLEDRLDRELPELRASFPKNASRE